MFGYRYFADVTSLYLNNKIDNENTTTKVELALQGT